MARSLWEHQQRAARLDTLLQEMALCASPEVQAINAELVQTLLELHGEGLAQILQVVGHSQSGGEGLIEALANDELLATLFVLHGLHPMALNTRVNRALADVHPYLEAHGASVELAALENNIAYLRLHMHDHTCSSSTTAFQTSIENVLKEAVPDLVGLDIETVLPEPVRKPVSVNFVPRKRKEKV